MTIGRYRFFLPRSCELLPESQLIFTEDLEGHSFGYWEEELSYESYQELLFHCRQFLGQGVTAFAFPWQGIPKSAFFDMDATVIQQESIVELARAAGKSEAVNEVTEQAMAGKIDFEEALLKRVQVLKGLSEDVFSSTSERLTYQPGINVLCRHLTEHSCPYYLVSGGFMELAESIGRGLGFHGVHANCLVIKNGTLTGEVGPQIVDGAEKLKYASGILEKNRVSRERVVVVGDGANDAAMMTLGSLAFGFRPKMALIPSLNGAVFQGDHSLLVNLLSSHPFR